MNSIFFFDDNDRPEIPDIISFTNVAILIFYSDESNTKLGFEATLPPEVIIDITYLNADRDEVPFCASDCVNIITFTPYFTVSPLYEDLTCLSDCDIANKTASNTIKSPNYPGNYPIWTTVYYTISAPGAQSVEIEFSEFNIEYHPTCENDWVTILNSDSEELLGKSCGREIPETTSFVNEATLVFRSDSKFTAKPGFSAELSAEVTIVITQLNTNPFTTNTRQINTWGKATKPAFQKTLGRHPWIIQPSTPYNELNPIEQITSRVSATKPFFEKTGGENHWIIPPSTSNNKINLIEQINSRIPVTKPSFENIRWRYQWINQPSISNTKLNPIEEINPWVSATKPVFENTLGRYPWICSLRGKEDKSHYCGATILSRPPGPLVIVTAAHCVFLCKSDTGETVPNCCCENVKGTLCRDNRDDNQCRDNPGVVVMTGEDAEVICGEFETGNFTADQSGEDYNVVLHIDSISVHPGYDITRGVNNSQYVVNDIATLHFEENLSESKVSQLIPVCLPEPQKSESKFNKNKKSFSLHAGWSAPPPPRLIETQYQAFLPYVREFAKMHHYNMTLTQCQDPQQYFDQNGATAINVTYTTNSYYPPGTICAREKNLEFCPTSGESGSPLMVKDEGGRFSIVGVNSFLKGCSLFSFTNTSLKQFSENPIVYSRLSCFLPWIAEQYNMSYNSVEVEQECREGVGNINEVTTEKCRTTPTDEFDRWFQVEAECIFPFTLDNVTHHQCTLSEQLGFTRPQFICPIRILKGRGANGTNYITADSDTTFCPTNFNSETIGSNSDMVLGPNGQWELDPYNENCTEQYKKFAFASCRNTCPGGERIFNLVNISRPSFIF